METKQAVRHFKNPVLLLIAIILIIMRCAVPPVYAEESSGKIKTLADFKGKTISMLSGTTFDVHLEDNEIIKGDVKILYQNTDVDSIASVLSGKSDAMIGDMPVAEIIVAEHDELMIFPEVIREDKYGFGFRKGSPLVEPFNEAMSRLKSQGLDEELKSKWMGQDESVKKLIPQDWEGKNGTLEYWVNTGTPPMSYLGPEGTPVGFAIDYVLHVAREMDYRVKITECAFDGLIPALQGGKADLAGRSMSITEERLKKIDFSDPFYSGGSVLVVLKKNVDESLLRTEETMQDEENGDGGFLSFIYNSFYRTFIQEERWRVFLTGLLNTLLITFTSMLFGCVLGFLLYFLCRKTGKKVQGVVDTITGIITGIPAVVLLMVLFYIIFGKSNISGIIVSIIAFTLTFGISVYSMLKTGTGAVDQGQTEGSYALGFSDNEAFFLIILPQALMHILPIFKGELVSLLKATAVVGYIAVQDLTRAGDMIRNRTFDAFFSLISVAIIYYVIGRILGWLINNVQKLVDPATRSKDTILKGVESDD